MVKIVGLKKEINDDIDRLIDLKKEIGEIISRLEDPSGQLVLEMRYLNNKDWEEIANEMNLGIRTIFRLHGKAIKEIELGCWLKDGSKSQ